jgi:hypothetical protein
MAYSACRPMHNQAAVSELARTGDGITTWPVPAGTAAARPDAFRPGLVSSLHNLSASLAALGRAEEALAAIEEAAGIRRELAAARPQPLTQVSWCRGRLLRLVSAKVRDEVGDCWPLCPAGEVGGVVVG